MTSSALRLAFAGTPELAAQILDSLLSTGNFDIRHVITSPDRPAGRGRKIRESAVKRLARESGIRVLQPGSAEELVRLSSFNGLDALVVAAFGMFLPAEIINQPRYGSINVHTSLLPRWRGAAPIQRAILAGDRTTGISIMQMDERLDTGDILLQESCEISASDTGGSLHDRLAVMGSRCLQQVLGRLGTGSLTPLPQDEGKAVYAGKISKAEAALDWSEPARGLERKVRAFNPVPVAHAQVNGISMRVWEADIAIADTAGLVPGTVLNAGSEGILVSTPADALLLKRIQVPGGKPLSAGEFLNGHPGFTGSRGNG